MTTKWVIANWKMNHLRAEASAFCEAFRADYKARPGVEAGIAPSFPLLPGVISQTETTGAKVFGQNAHWEPKGAFTGAVSMAQLKDAGCHGVILGHSERRQFFNETDDSLVKKLFLCALAVCGCCRMDHKRFYICTYSLDKIV